MGHFRSLYLATEPTLHLHVSLGRSYHAVVYHRSTSKATVQLLLLALATAALEVSHPKIRCKDFVAHLDISIYYKLNILFPIGVYHIVTNHAFWVGSIVTYHRMYRKKYHIVTDNFVYL